MASIKQLDERRYKITVSNGYRPNGKKISKAKTIQVPPGVPKRGIGQYVAHAAEELERSFKTGYAEDGEMTFEEFASRWLKRQIKYAPSTIAAYRRMLEVVYPMIGGTRLNKLRPMALENMLSELRKRKHHGKHINESTAQRYLSVVSAVLSDAKRNEIIEKNPARMLDLPTPQRTVQLIHPDTFTKRLRKIYAAIGFPQEYHLHTLRHYFVTSLLHCGVDKQTAADLVGHVDTGFLERTYCHPQQAQKEQAADSMRTMLRPDGGQIFNLAAACSPKRRSA